jgi:ketosteroid isomerase-like protein
VGPPERRAVPTDASVGPPCLAAAETPEVVESSDIASTLPALKLLVERRERRFLMARLARRRRSSRYHHGILGGTMSPNIELVRRWYALLPSLGGTDPNDDSALFDRMFRDYLDEEYELRLPGGYPEGEPVFRGREGAAQLLAMLRDAWAEWRFEPERFIEADDQVVVFVRVVAKGSASGVPIELPDAHVVTVRDGRLTSTCVYRDRSEALEAVGLQA